MGLRTLLGLKKDRPVMTTRLKAQVYPFVPKARPYAQTRAGRALVAALEARRAQYSDICRRIAANAGSFSDIPAVRESPVDPHWDNPYFPPLDGLSLYALLQTTNPATYVEIGSGTSTKYARKAIRDHGLRTRIVSIDPEPRAEIDDLCDVVIREPFQDFGEKVLDLIAPGDMLFQDGSHHVFTNTDATVFFTEVVPVLPPGVTYGIHDIFLPEDYPANWHKRFYNEQYIWIAHLLAGAGGDEMVFPARFVGLDDALCEILAPAFALPELGGRRPSGGAFWMRSAGRWAGTASPV